MSTTNLRRIMPHNTSENIHIKSEPDDEKCFVSMRIATELNSQVDTEANCHDVQIKQEPSDQQEGTAEMKDVELYADHELKQEMVIGPTVLQQHIPLFKIKPNRKDITLSIQKNMACDTISKDICVRSGPKDKQCYDFMSAVIEEDTQVITEADDSNYKSIKQEPVDQQEWAAEIKDVAIPKDIILSIQKNVCCDTISKDICVRGGPKDKQCYNIMSADSQAGTSETDFSNKTVKQEPADQQKGAEEMKDVELYADHEIKKEMVIGPTVLQQPVPSAAQVYEDNTKGHKSSSQYCCEVCYHHFDCPSDLAQHRHSHIQYPLDDVLKNGGENSFVCEVCNKTFSRRFHLNSHLRVHTNEKPFTCDICKKQFKDKLYLGYHLRMHRGDTPHSCHICKKSFILKSHLTTHIHSHNEKKAFSCKVCNKQFNRNFDLKRHSIVHSGEKPFSCEICKKQFTRSSGLSIHLRTHSDEKLFSCNFCKKSFTLKSRLIVHLHSHSKKKPFSCKVCKKQFNRSSDLKRHLLIHSGEKPFSCEICERRFTQSSGLSAHLRSHKAKKTIPL